MLPGKYFFPVIIYLLYGGLLVLINSKIANYATTVNSSVKWNTYTPFILNTRQLPYENPANVSPGQTRRACQQSIGRLSQDTRAEMESKLIITSSRQAICERVNEG